MNYYFVKTSATQRLKTVSQRFLGVCLVRSLGSAPTTITRNVGVI